MIDPSHNTSPILGEELKNTARSGPCFSLLLNRADFNFGEMLTMAEGFALAGLWLVLGAGDLAGAGVSHNRCGELTNVWCANSNLVTIGGQKGFELNAVPDFPFDFLNFNLGLLADDVLLAASSDNCEFHNQFLMNSSDV